jgi:uncharacterized protein with von Willebrand factor type A (vWA) domain
MTTKNAVNYISDDITPINYGVNGHLQFEWSHDIKEKILQFTFQTVRSDAFEIQILQNKLIEILTSLNYLKKEDKIEYTILLYKFIAHTRDIIDGKGECQLTYMMIFTWSLYHFELSIYMIEQLISNKNGHSLGSFKDLKYLCKYCKEQSIRYPKESTLLIDYCIKLLNDKLAEDELKYIKGEKISLVAKWIPRENNSFGFLFEQLAISYYPEYFQLSATNHKAVKKAYTNYRKVVSKLNRYLDTVQIKQCDKNWKDINFDNVTSITFSKQKLAFLNLKKDNSERVSLIDRRICRKNMTEFISEKLSSDKEINGKCTSMDYFTKEALNLINLEYIDQSRVDLLNSQWKSNSTHNSLLNNIIPMVDISGSMDGVPKNTAISLGIRIAEKSSIGKRLMTFESVPKWINLDDCKDYLDMVKKTESASCGWNTNFYAALELILSAIQESKLPYNEVKNLVLVILSDMQIDKADNSFDKCMIDMIKYKFNQVGNLLYNKPIKVPHIIFWNLSSTNGFPCLNLHDNVSMVSGYNPRLINKFCNLGVDGFSDYTPWSRLIKLLENKKYDLLESKCNVYFDR